MAVPSTKRILEDVDSIPNTQLEQFYREGMTKGINRFGKRIFPPKEVLEYVRQIMLERNREGNYVFQSRAEKRKLRIVGIRDPKIDLLCA